MLPPLPGSGTSDGGAAGQSNDAWIGGSSPAQARAFVDCLGAQAQQHGQVDAVCLFVDDLEALDVLCDSAYQARALVAAACAALEGRGCETLVCFGRGDESGGAGGVAPESALDVYGGGSLTSSLHGGPGLSSYCESRAHVLVRVGVMHSGASSEAQGRLDVDFLAPWGGTRGGSADRMVYKIAGADCVIVESRKAGLG